MEHHILGLTDKGKTKFLLELFSDWVDESNRKKCKTFSKEQADYLIPLLKSENNGEESEIILKRFSDLERSLFIKKLNIIHKQQSEKITKHLGKLIIHVKNF